MDGELVGEVPALRDLDGVDLADEVGDRGVGRRQLLAEATLAVHPLDRALVAPFRDEHAGVLGDGGVRVVVDLAAGHDGHPLVEERGERPDHAGLALPPLPQEDHVVPSDERVLELREDGVLVTDDAFDEGLACGNTRKRVRPHFFLDGARHPSTGLELAEGSGSRHVGFSLVSRAGRGHRTSGPRVCSRASTVGAAPDERTRHPQPSTAASERDVGTGQPRACGAVVGIGGIGVDDDRPR